LVIGCAGWTNSAMAIRQNPPVSQPSFLDILERRSVIVLLQEAWAPKPPGPTSTVGQVKVGFPRG
jgi:hypothetical protein